LKTKLSKNGCFHVRILEIIENLLHQVKTGELFFSEKEDNERKSLLFE